MTCGTGDSTVRAKLPDAGSALMPGHPTPALVHQSEQEADVCQVIGALRPGPTSHRSLTHPVVLFPFPEQRVEQTYSLTRRI